MDAVLGYKCHLLAMVTLVAELLSQNRFRLSPVSDFWPGIDRPSLEELQHLSLGFDSSAGSLLAN